MRKKKGEKMVAIGNIKLGMRIEPIYVHELSREEVDRILQANGIFLNQDVPYPIDTSIISSFRTDSQKLKEYIEVCKYAFDKKNGIDVQKPNAKRLSIFDDELQINYELKHLKESESISEAEKVKIYKQAKATQNLFRMFGAKNINLEMSLLDKAYFSIQSLLQGIKLRGKTPALIAGENKPTGESGEFRKELFDGEAQKATERVSEEWKDHPHEVSEKEDELTKS